jgi:hypothetical protein
MALIHCKECDQQVSSKAEICPHCGVRLSPLLGCLRWIIYAFAAAMFIGIVAAMNADKTQHPSAQSAPTPPEPEPSAAVPAPAKSEPPPAPAAVDGPISPTGSTASTGAAEITEEADTVDAPGAVDPPPRHRRKVDRHDHLQQCRDLVHLTMMDEGLELHGKLLRQPEPTIDGLRSVWTVRDWRFDCVSQPTSDGGFNHSLFHKGQLLHLFPNLPGPQ